MKLILTQTPLNRPSLKEWMIKHNVSGNIISSKYSTLRAIKSEQLKEELLKY